MDVTKLKKEIKETIFPNGEKKIKGQKHQDMLFGLVDEIDRSDGLMRADIALNQETAMENRDNINDLRDETNEKFGKVDASISDINIREAETTKEIDIIKNALRDVTSGKDNGQITGGKVINIPTQATNSVAGYAIEGLTATQLVQNGDFRDGLKNWRGYRANLTLKDNILQCEANGDGTNGYAINRFNEPIPSGVYYSKIIFALNNEDCLHVALRTSKGVMLAQANDLATIGVKQLSAVYNLPTQQPDIEIIHNYKSQSEAKGKVLQIFSLATINLTETFGAGNEPTKEWCDEHFPEYFDGTKSVELPVRIKSVGENLWDNSKVILGRDAVRTETGYFKRKGVWGSCKMPLRVERGVEYELSLKYTGQARATIREFESKEIISPLSNITKRIFKSKSGLIEVAIDSSSSELNIDVEVSNIQVAKTPSSGFGKYTENLSYINSKATLKSALQAKDYVENGTLFKNIFTTKEFKKDDVRRQYISENLVDNYAFYLDIDENKWLKDGFVNNNRIARFSDGETYSCVGSTIETDVEDIVFLIDSARNYIMLKINKSKVDELSGATPLDKFKAYWGSRTLEVNYQANVEKIKLDTSGVVTTHENGTIFIDYIKNRTDIYNKGIEVLDFKELVSLQKYEGIDLVELDISKAKYASNKLTHPDLKDGDIVFFEYRYTDLSIYGENTIEYFNKNNVLQSENGKLWQKVEKASNEGVLTTELKEIV